MKTLQEKYNAIQEGTFSKQQFLRDVRLQLPNLITQFNGYEDAVRILKNKGMLNEEVEKAKYSLESLWRGIDYELEEDGTCAVETVPEEIYEKAKQKAKKNLERDPLHYLNLVAGEYNFSTTSNSMTSVKRGSVEKDLKNGMKKVALQERKKEKNTKCDCRPDPIILKEKKLTAAEKKKKNQTVKSLKEPSMKKSDQSKHTIATARTKKLAEVKEGMKTIIKNILSEEKQSLHEAKTENLEKFINFENNQNPELAARVRKNATALAEHIAKIEKMYVDSRENIEKIFTDIGPFLSPKVYRAYRDDIIPVLAKYQKVQIPEPTNINSKQKELLDKYLDKEELQERKKK